MLFHTHILLGIVFFLLLKNFFHVGNSWILFLLVLLGSILPDIDERKSKMNRWSGIIGEIVSFFAKHRGIFHSLLFVGVLFLLIWNIWGLHYGIALFIGYIAHLFGDALTPMGIKPFYPFSKYSIRGPIRTGGMWETVILVLLIIFAVGRLL